MKRLVFAACLAATPAVGQSTDVEREAFEAIMGIVEQAMVIVNTGTCEDWLGAMATREISAMTNFFTNTFVNGYSAASGIDPQEAFTQIMESCREHPDRPFSQAIQ